jgi:two-component system NtrC family response regulator
MAQKKKRILVVDDDKETVALLKNILTKEKKYEVLTALAAEDALSLLESENVDLVMTDLKMPGMTGAEFLSELRNWDGGLPVIFVSGCAKDDDWQEAIRDQASALISKPFRKETILKAVSKALSPNGAVV